MTEIQVKKGGIGRFLPPCHGGAFGLKLLRLRNTDGTSNPGFWIEAQCVHSYGSAVRFQGGSLKIPSAPRYFIHKEDPHYDPNVDCSRALTLKGLFAAAFIENRKEILKEYENYKPVKEETLQQIYDKEDNADLLMVYPMFNGGENNLTVYYNSEDFSSADVRDLIVQILSAILDLYRSGRAHGDIKPENIMVQEISGKKIFRLTDFGSTHSEQMPSDSGTGAFFNRKLYQTILDRSKEELLARVYTDFYALVRTVLALALGRHPKDGAPFNPECVTDKWAEIKPLWDELRNTENITIERVRQIVSENSLPKGCNYTPFYTYVNDEFEEMRVDHWNDNDISYGRLHEQISFSNEFDPMMKISGISFDPSVYELFPEFYHLPLLEGYRWMIFHAPDDPVTGKRPRDFTNYRPMTLALAETAVSSEEKERLKRYGRKLNKYFAENKEAQAFLPDAEQIFRVDGQLKLLWGIGIKLNRPIDYEKYFSFLMGEKVCFSYPDWRDLLFYIKEIARDTPAEYWQEILTEITCASSMANYEWLYSISQFCEFAVSKVRELSTAEWLCVLPHIPELRKKLTVEVCRRLLREFADHKEYAWLFGIDLFRKKIAKETLKFSAEHWLAILKYTHDFDDKIDLETAFTMYQLGNMGQKESLLETIEGLQERILEDPEERFRYFCKCGKYDEKTFLTCFPPEVHANFSSRRWNKFLRTNPALIQYVPERMLPKLNRKAWVKVLDALPEFFEKCGCTERFTSKDWCSILIQQPALKKFVPPEIEFSDSEIERLENKQFDI